jgi:hypothetical protein
VYGLLLKLAFYTGNDPVQMDRLIGESALYSAKFDTRRGGQTWIVAEIGKAIARTTETYSPKNTGAQFDSSEPKKDGSDESNLKPLPGLRPEGKLPSLCPSRPSG